MRRRQPTRLGLTFLGALFVGLGVVIGFGGVVATAMSMGGTVRQLVYPLGLGLTAMAVGAVLLVIARG
jgi:hypothetical protein